MTTINENLIKEASGYVETLLREKLDDDFVFHNFEHTEYVTKKAEWIGKNCGLSQDEINFIKLCALFHDTGYITGYEEHEIKSAEIASDFLKSKNIDEQTITKIKNCILSTRIPQNPNDLISRVVCDADMAHLAEDDYFERVDKMRQEWKKTRGEKFSKRKFHKISEKFFRQHTYLTDFAKKELEPKKEKNMRLIEKEIYLLELNQNKKTSKKDKKKNKTIKYSRGVESMFRNTARMQINLSSIADKKSNILISVNSIIISLTITVLVSRFEETPNIILPTLVFLFFSLVTIVFAILSTRPQVSSGTFDKKDLKDSKVNLLFFGNFYNMDFEDYECALAELMKNDNRLYSTMILDQYSLGKVLAKKYKLLRIAYNVFMFGIIISVLIFIFAYLNN